MPYEVDSPLAAGFGAAAGLLSGISQGKHDAEEQRRQQQLDKEHAIALAAQTEYQRSQQSDETTRLGYEGKRLGIEEQAAQDAHASAIQKQVSDKANFEFDKKTKPLQYQLMVNQVLLSRGQINSAQFALEQTKIQTQLDSIQLGIAKKYAVPEEELKLSQGMANIGSTDAGTAATQFGTARGQAMLPGELTWQSLTNRGKALDNSLSWQALNPASTGGVPPTVMKSMESDYAHQLTSFTSRIDDYNKRAAANKLTPGEAAPVAPVSPTDFVALVQNTVDKIKQQPALYQKAVQDLESAPLSPSQKRYALQALKAAVGGQTPLTPIPGGAGGPMDLGGSNAAPPFQASDPVMRTEFRATKPYLQSAFSRLLPLQPFVTSVSSGHHVKGSAHYDGRAVDVGADKTGQLGFYDRNTWNFVVHAVTSGGWSRIGTNAKVVDGLKAWAAQRGVDLFEDDDEPHVHLQVASQ